MTTMRLDDLGKSTTLESNKSLWVLCLYFMGLNVSNEQIAHELALNDSDVHQMTTQLRQGLIKKSPR